MSFQIVTSFSEVSVAFLAFMQREVLYSSVVFVIVFALTWLLRRRSPHFQYGLLTFVLLRLVLPPDFSLSVSARSLLEKAVCSHASVASTLPTVFQNSAGNVLDAGGMEPNAPSAAAMANPASLATLNFLQMGIFAFWILGVIIFLVIFAKRYAYYLRIVRNATDVTEARFLTPLHKWHKRYAIKQKIRLVTSEHCLSPFTMGLIRPVIYLPRRLFDAGSMLTVESIIAHELTHIRNRDDMWIKLQNLVQIFYFFHPVVWLTSSRLNELRERICDERVLSYGEISPASYGTSMLTVLRMNLLGVEGIEMLPSFGNHKKKISDRIRKITGGHKNKQPNLFGISATLLLSAIFLLPMAHSAHLAKVGIDGNYIRLDRVVGGQGDFKLWSRSAGARFEAISNPENSELFCTTTLPINLQHVEYAAIGVYDSDFHKVWVLKGSNAHGETRFYLDTDGDDCFTDEAPLVVKKKTAKYHYEDSSEWILTEYLKSKVAVDYERIPGRTEELAVHLVYISQKNLLEFSNNEFWVGEADFDGVRYPIALTGGLHASWFLRPTFDEKPDGSTKNELRIDLNRNGVFEDMSVYDPVRNDVIQEKYYTCEPFQVEGRTYVIESVKRDNSNLFVKIIPKPNTGS